MFLWRILIHLHCVRKHFLQYCLPTFRTAEILKYHIKDCFRTNGKQRIKMPKKVNKLDSPNYERKIKSPFMIYENFESMLVLENNGKK